jgi:hypothetical protein
MPAHPCRAAWIFFSLAAVTSSRARHTVAGDATGPGHRRFRIVIDPTYDAVTDVDVAVVRALREHFATVLWIRAFGMNSL